MKTSKILAAAIFSAIGFGAGAQVNQTQFHTNGRQVQVTKHRSEEATGSKYKSETFMPAQVPGKTDKVLVRYNVYDDLLEMQDPYTKETSTLVKTEGEKIIVTGKSAYVYTNYENEKGEKTSGYLSIIAQSPNTTIYRKERIILIPEKMPSKSYDVYKAPHYKPADDEFYIAVNGSKEAMPLPDNKKEFAKLFPGKDKQVLDYIKQNKIDLDEDQDLSRLGEYLKTI